MQWSVNSSDSSAFYKQISLWPFLLWPFKGKGAGSACPDWPQTNRGSLRTAATVVAAKAGSRTFLEKAKVHCQHPPDQSWITQNCQLIQLNQIKLGDTGSQTCCMIQKWSQMCWELFWTCWLFETFIKLNESFMNMSLLNEESRPFLPKRLWFVLQKMGCHDNMMSLPVQEAPLIARGEISAVFFLGGGNPAC